MSGWRAESRYLCCYGVCNLLLACFEQSRSPDNLIHSSCLASVTKVEASFYLELGSKSDRLQFKVSCTAGVTEIEASFLLESGSPLLEVSEPLADPQPIYSQKRGCVLAWHDVMFGKHGWTLPRMQQLHNDAEIRARVFAMALLSGKVINEFKGMNCTVAFLFSQSFFLKARTPEDKVVLSQCTTKLEAPQKVLASWSAWMLNVYKQTFRSEAKKVRCLIENDDLYQTRNARSEDKFSDEVGGEIR